MRALTAADLLDVWEQGTQAHPLVRPLVVLAAAFPEIGPADLAAEPLGAVNARLWQVRAALVGTEVVGCAGCPACGEQVEFDLDATCFAVPPEPGDGEGARPVSLADLFAAVDEPDPAGVLAARCAPAGPGPGPELAAALERVDPAAEVLLAMACPACGHRWPAPLDVASFLWAELDRIAAAVLSDVDALARSYGWSERDVLALSPARRRCYVETARAGA